ncbi:MAG: hypothetical protein V1663_05035 [archaeon]
MVLKTFNINEEIYDKFSKFCKEHGISMSKQVEIFIESQIGDEEEIRPEYLKRLEKIRKGKYHKFNTVAELRKAIEK